ncbi:FkbM family methyltransferase [Sphingopyxis macrogoltabida]|uniref:FkbM family methyltransferase n=1 Tax=Sphingopyxis macrogoltabida TaxID=33050 RepID=A0AAC9AY91_SPHMC|nr:FkbM family methyltransferase [Sphingopyxis macrogoltabida]ALJ15658.1 hypothetical protein LH19_22520 [Sphingopyxis macrogoltabida]AMU91899.1 hypothetical protein ATM17_23080 [Sphingopyxis macrogoltabida]
MIEFARKVRDALFAATHRNSVVDVAGITLTLDNASPRMRYVMHKGYETEDAELASAVLDENDVVLEAGSATGFLAIHCLKNIGVRSYDMVEANEEMIPVIHRNFELNGLASPKLTHAAVAAVDGTISFGINRDFWSSSTTSRKGERRVSVPSRSLPSLAKAMAVPPTALVMDIEGGEAAIPLDHFLLFEKIVIETHRKLVGDQPIEKLLAFLAEKGFAEIGRNGGSYAFRKSAA